MKRTVEYAPSYLRNARKIAKRHPDLKKIYTETLNRLQNDPFDPRLHTHPLTGNLKGNHACSLTHELRIVFKLHDDIIHLLDIGSHDEVY